MRSVRTVRVIRQEVEARKISDGVKTNVNLKKFNPIQQKQSKPPTANALLSQDDTRRPSRDIQLKCAYCGGAHFSASCETVSEPRACFEILFKS